MTNMSLKPATLIKKRLCHRYFPVNFAKFLKTPFLPDTSWRLLLWIASAGVIYHGKCNYYVLINCARHSVRRKSIQNHFKIFNFLLIWDKNLWSRTGWPVAKPFWIRLCEDNTLTTNNTVLQNFPTVRL